jgi:uncharacterized integral membrane protein
MNSRKILKNMQFSVTNVKILLVLIVIVFIVKYVKIFHMGKK